MLHTILVKEFNSIPGIYDEFYYFVSQCLNKANSLFKPQVLNVAKKIIIFSVHVLGRQLNCKNIRSKKNRFTY